MLGLGLFAGWHDGQVQRLQDRVGRDSTQAVTMAGTGKWTGVHAPLRVSVENLSVDTDRRKPGRQWPVAISIRRSRTSDTPSQENQPSINCAQEGVSFVFGRSFYPAPVTRIVEKN